MIKTIAKSLLCALPCLAAGLGGRGQQAASRPNIIFIYIDDMGYGDLSCYGNREISTPQMDRLAREGLRFTDFYVSSPVCSPSRAGVITGQYPARNRITGYIDSRWKNQQREMADFLDTAAPTIARTLQRAGYATAHIGKWHLGGGRDIGDVPLPAEYGYDKTLVAFEGLGDRVLIRHSDELNAASARLGKGRITWVDHDYQKTPLFVDTAMAFIRDHRKQPFYVELWLNDVHDPFEARPDLMARYKRFANDKYKQQYFATIANVDESIGRLLDMLDRAGLARNTIVFLSSDNGPTDWPRYYHDFYYPPGSAGDFRGRKWSLYEGGIREPLLVRWPGHIPAGAVDSVTMTWNLDVFPTLCDLAGIALPAARLDGQDEAAAWLGRPQKRTGPLMWVYGFNSAFLKPGNPRYRSPDLAIRDGKWKLLVNDSGSGAELYDLTSDVAEADNLADRYPAVVRRLADQVIRWWKSMPR